MRITTVVVRIFALKPSRIRRSVQLDPDGLLLDVAPTTPVPICSGCFKRVRAVHDTYQGRRWRHLDVAGMRLWLQYEIRRVRRPRCGVTVELVPWAEPQPWFRYEFEQHVAYLAQLADKTTLSDMMLHRVGHGRQHHRARRRPAPPRRSARRPAPHRRRRAELPSPPPRAASSSRAGAWGCTETPLHGVAIR